MHLHIHAHICIGIHECACMCVHTNTAPEWLNAVIKKAILALVGGLTSTSWIMKTLHPYLSKTPARFCSSEAWLSALRTRSRALRLDICMTSSSTWLRSLLVHKRSSSLCRSSCCMEKLKCKYMHADLLVCMFTHEWGVWLLALTVRVSWTVSTWAVAESTHSLPLAKSFEVKFCSSWTFSFFSCTKDHQLRMCNERKPASDFGTKCHRLKPGARLPLSDAKAGAVYKHT